MSMFVGFESIMPERKRIKVDYIVPERIKDVGELRGKTLSETLRILDISNMEYKSFYFRKTKIPKEVLFKLEKYFEMPKAFFYTEVWERV